jgi:hypothetical protein
MENKPARFMEDLLPQTLGHPKYAFPCPRINPALPLIPHLND